MGSLMSGSPQRGVARAAASPPPRMMGQAAASPLRGKAKLCTTYGLKTPSKCAAESSDSDNDGWRNCFGTLSPALLSSTGQLPSIISPIGGSLSLAASMSLSCLRPPPRTPPAYRGARAEFADPPLPQEQATPPRRPGLPKYEPLRIAQSEPLLPQGPMGERLRGPPPRQEELLAFQEALPSHRSQASDHHSRSHSPVRRKGQKPKVKSRSHTFGHNSVGQDASTPDARSVAAELARRRSNFIRRQMLIENDEYMDGQLGDLRRGKVGLKNRMSQCTDDELFENRSFYTSYAMSIHQRSELRKERDKLKAMAAKEDAALSSHGQASGKSLSVTWGASEVHHPEWHQAPSMSTLGSASRQNTCEFKSKTTTDSVSHEQPIEDQQRRRKKRGETEVCTVAAEVVALREQMKDSHKKLQADNRVIEAGFGHRQPSKRSASYGALPPV